MFLAAEQAGIQETQMPLLAQHVSGCTGMSIVNCPRCPGQTSGITEPSFIHLFSPVGLSAWPKGLQTYDLDIPNGSRVLA